jgi:hypothetical protein
MYFEKKLAEMFEYLKIFLSFADIMLPLADGKYSPLFDIKTDNFSCLSMFDRHLLVTLDYVHSTGHVLEIMNLD